MACPGILFTVYLILVIRKNPERYGGLTMKKYH